MIGDRWGATDEEIDRRYPCDEWVSPPRLEAWRAVTIESSVERVWQWVTQIRLAPYSYDWIDNLGRRSPQSLQGMDDPSVDEPFTTALGGLRLGRVLSFDRGHQLTGEIAGAVISYVLEPKTATRTRLLMKITSPRPPLIASVTAPLLALGDLVMARRQLLNIKQLVERSASDPSGRRVTTSIGDDAIPAEVRSLVTFAHVDYIDLYSTTVSAPITSTPERWARAVLEEAPLARRSARQLWRAIGLRLGPIDSDRHVQGWRISSQDNRWIRCETSSPYLSAQAIFIVDDTQLRVCVALHYDHPIIARPVWNLVAGPHQRAIPIMIRQALSRVDHR